MNTFSKYVSWVLTLAMGAALGVAFVSTGDVHQAACIVLLVLGGGAAAWLSAVNSK